MEKVSVEPKKREKELEVFHQENESLKGQLNEAASEISTGQAKKEEMTSRLSQLEVDLEESRGNEVKLKEKLEAVEEANEALETKMKKLRVHTEQWRKAADAATTVLAEGIEMNGG
ncbi:Interactor of constitutive active ROPs 1 [Camellia lanceoleosa]|uniref:Interactor of constitutive active ROPs 1 n=1 Tax=Camellia lanceoleosa TaxID=1840588 RepID=A0ACC0IKI4_9ERIC|nr:Interactor of constitutive active ROPs 1 [Camellia lanceoleosa]